MKKKVLKGLIVIGYLIGFSVLLYPTISNFINERNASRVISNYDDSTVHLSDIERETMLDLARKYNSGISDMNMIDPFSKNQSMNKDSLYEGLLDVNGVGMMGYLRIPTIHLELPIYHGTSESVLQVGIGHLENSSLPVGGNSTHAVLTSHRGLPSAKLFSELDQLTKGDVFYIKVLGETLAYQVNQILTVLPNEMESLNIVKNKDYVTLVTCTPYAVNTHRLLVRGTRIPYTEAIEQVADEKIGFVVPFELKLLVIGALSIVIMGCVIKKIKKGKGRENG